MAESLPGSNIRGIESDDGERYMRRTGTDDYSKEAQTWGAGRAVVSDKDRKDVKKARKEGRLAEAMLDRRAAMKRYVQYFSDHQLSGMKLIFQRSICQITDIETWHFDSLLYVNLSSSQDGRSASRFSHTHYH